MRRNSRFYALVPSVIIETCDSTPVLFRQKIERELGFYRCEPEVGDTPILTVDKEENWGNLSDLLKISKTGVAYSSQCSAIVLRLGTGYVVIRDLFGGNVVHFSCYGNVSIRDAWYYLENIYKHICLLTKKVVFVHGCGFELENQPFFMLGWSGVGKTFMLLEAFRRNAVFWAEDFILLSKTGIVYPYVPAYFDFGYYHILKFNLLDLLPVNNRLKILLVNVTERLMSRLGPKFLQKVGDRLVRNSRYYYLKWSNIFKTVEYQREAVGMQKGYWFVLKNTNGNELFLKQLSSSFVTSSLAASVLYEMREYLNMLWQLEFLAVDIKQNSTRQIIKTVFSIIENLPYEAQTIYEVKLPENFEPEKTLDFLLQNRK